MTRLVATAPVARSRPPGRTPVDPRALAPGGGTWSPGVAMGASGVRRYRVYRPPGIVFGERLPLMVMCTAAGRMRTALH